MGSHSHNMVPGNKHLLDLEPSHTVLVLVDNQYNVLCMNTVQSYHPHRYNGSHSHHQISDPLCTPYH